MTIPVLAKLRRFAHRRRMRSTDGVLVLMYHRIADLDHDPWGIVVSPRHFDEQLDVLRRLGRAMRLEELIRALGAGKLPHRAVVVTFDDGYLDNLEQARPTLERHDVPATLFTTSGTLGAKHELWWDELERVLLHPPELPSVLELRLRGETHRFELGAGAKYSEDERRRDLTIPVWEAEPGSRAALFCAVHAALRPSAEPELADAMVALREWAGAADEFRPACRMMTPEQLREMAAGGLVTIGGHTVSHPDLPSHDRAAQRREIADGRAALEAIVGAPVTTFAYPYGRYAPESVDLVRELGFAGACTTEERVVRPSANLWELPRFGVPNVDGAAFERWLGECFEG